MTTDIALDPAADARGNTPAVLRPAGPGKAVPGGMAARPTAVLRSGPPWATLPPGWHVHEVTPALEIRVARAMPALPAALEAEIDRLWAAAQQRMRGTLFNGRVFSADTLTPSLVTGHWTEFRRIVAQMDRNELFAQLGLRPLAVNGVLFGPDGVVLGQRPAGAVYQPGRWQLPPAGSIDDRAARADGSVDVLGALLAELREEVGLPAAAVRVLDPVAIVEHAGSHVLDLGMALRTELTGDEISLAHAATGNGEYAKLEMIPPADLTGFLSRMAASLAPQTPVFLGRLGLLSGRDRDMLISECN